MGNKKAVVRYNPENCGLLDIIRMASTALNEIHQGYEAEAMKRRIRAEAQTLDNAFKIISEYVTLKRIRKHRQ